MRAEDRIHIALMLALGAANLALFVCGPFERPLRPAQAARLAVSELPVEARRSEVDAAIVHLEAWLSRARAQNPPGLPTQLALQGLGPTPDDREHPERWLARVLGGESASSWLAPTRSATPAPGAERQTLTTALVILLESGVPLEQQLWAASAEKAPGLRLSELLQRTLESEVASADAHANELPGQLDLLSLAVLGGLTQYRERLARATQRSLRELERAQRARNVQPGSGAIDEPRLAQMASAWRQQVGPEAPGALELHCSAAVFRATAVLSDDDLERQARRHLSALLSRYRSDRALYRYLDATAGDAREQKALRLQALENLGRLEEALYNAHLAFRSDAGSSPAPDTAQVMRLAARDLIDRLQALDSGVFDVHGAAGQQGREELFRAAVHALRGLRTARVAG